MKSAKGRKWKERGRERNGGKKKMGVEKERGGERRGMRCTSTCIKCSVIAKRKLKKRLNCIA